MSSRPTARPRYQRADLSIKLTHRPFTDAADDSPIGPIRSVASVARSSRRHSPYLKPPSTLGLSDPLDGMKLDSVSSHTRMKIKNGKVVGGGGYRPWLPSLAPIGDPGAAIPPLPSLALPPLAEPDVAPSSSRAHRLPSLSAVSAPCEATTSASAVASVPLPSLSVGAAASHAAAPVAEGRRTRAALESPAKRKKAPVPPTDPGSSGGGSSGLRERIRERKQRSVAAAAEAESARRAAEDESERTRVVRMLREYEEEVTAPPSPSSELYQQAEGCIESNDARELRQRLRAAFTAAAGVAEASGSAASLDLPSRSSGGGGGGGGEDSNSLAEARAWLRPSGRPPTLTRAAFTHFIGRLAVAGNTEARSDEAFIAGRVFDSLDTGGRGEVTSEQAVRGVFPAWSKDKLVRRRWTWARMYDHRHAGHLNSTDIWNVLSSLPPGTCRIEEDLLAIIKVAAAKSDAGLPAKVTLEEYLRGLDGASTEDPDVLGLRRRRKSCDAARLFRIRAHSLELAARWAKPHVGATAAPGAAAAPAAAAGGSGAAPPPSALPPPPAALRFAALLSKKASPSTE